VLRAAPGLIESIWLVAPASLTDPDARAEGILWRGERLVADATTMSFFAPDFMGSSGRPPAGATEELSGGILWMQVMLAAQTSVVHERWQVGLEQGDAASGILDEHCRSPVTERRCHRRFTPGVGVDETQSKPLTALCQHARRGR